MTVTFLSLLISMFWPLMQEYLRLSDVYKMYGNASLPSCSSSPAALHCLSLSVAPALPCEVDICWFFAVLFLISSLRQPLNISSYCLLSFCVRPVSFCTCAGGLSAWRIILPSVSWARSLGCRESIPPLPPLFHHSNSPPLKPPFHATQHLPPFLLHRFAVNCSLACLIFSEMATLLREHFSFLISARCFCHWCRCCAANFLFAWVLFYHLRASLSCAGM